MVDVQSDAFQREGGTRCRGGVVRAGGLAESVDVVVDARRLAERLREHLPMRWCHVKGVAHAATQLSFLSELERDVVEAGAWLHDIGYLPEFADTGLHALDGARAVRALGFRDDVAALVAHHSLARTEAEIRGLVGELDREFSNVNTDLLDVLTYCDMTTGPIGERVTVAWRLREIRQRYGAGHVVARFIDRAGAELISTVRRVERRLSAGHAGQPM